MNMSMLNYFFSNKYVGRSDLFEGLKVWKDPAMREQQGKWPVIFLSFADVKASTYASAMKQIKTALVKAFSVHAELYQTDIFNRNEQIALNRISVDMDDIDAAMSLHTISTLLEKIHGKKVLIFLDEYDTPFQEAYMNGYLDELLAFSTTMFIDAFKANWSLERGILTGITRVNDPGFSDLNNLVLVTTTSELYATAFGFTEEEVFDALEQQGFGETDKQEVKRWYGGFMFGSVKDIYNPCSVTSFLDKGKLDTYWANNSSNGMIGKLLRTGDPEIKSQFEILLEGGNVTVPVDEQIVYNQLDTNPNAVWGLLLATGYLKVLHAMTVKEAYELNSKRRYTLTLPNLEVRRMFSGMIQDWFAQTGGLSEFVRAMLEGDVESMKEHLADIMLTSMSSFDGGTLSIKLPENFYHGLVLGILVESSMDYLVTSNRESGYGRYDVVMEPKESGMPAVIMEFKVFDSLDDEKGLQDTAENALKQIEEKHYEADLLAKVPAENILKYGFAFQGKECLIRKR